MKIKESYLVSSQSGVCELYLLDNGIWILNEPIPTGQYWMTSPNRINDESAKDLIKESKKYFGECK